MVSGMETTTTFTTTLTTSSTTTVMMLMSLWGVLKSGSRGPPEMSGCGEEMDSATA